MDSIPSAVRTKMCKPKDQKCILTNPSKTPCRQSATYSLNGLNSREKATLSLAYSETPMFIQSNRRSKYAEVGFKRVIEPVLSSAVMISRKAALWRIRYWRCSQARAIQRHLNNISSTVPLPFSVTKRSSTNKSPHPRLTRERRAKSHRQSLCRSVSWRT